MTTYRPKDREAYLLHHLTDHGQGNKEVLADLKKETKENIAKLE